MTLPGRIVLIVALMAAPWAFGSVTPEPQWFLGLTLVGLLAWWTLEILFGRADEPLHVPAAVLAPVGLLLVAALQLLPRETSMLAQMQHAAFPEFAEAFQSIPAQGTVSPATTRLQAALLFYAIAAFLLGAAWFSTPRAQVWLWMAITINGAALGFFGIIQKITWNGRLYWSVPLGLGGSPFASYVNRNNAAGYLNLCLAAGIGWLVYCWGSRSSGQLHAERVGARQLPWKARILRGIAEIDGATLCILGLMVVLGAAVVDSVSRGGIVAFVCALVMIIWWQRGRSRLLVATGALVLVSAMAGTVAWAGGWTKVSNRLMSLIDPSSAVMGRWRHWQDTFGAVRDFPLLGTGLGTYRYANQPYQQNEGDSWYVNADNLYFEILVETGTVGLMLFVGGIIFLGAAAAYLLRQRQMQAYAAGITGLFAVTSQAVQAATDFGLLIPANALTFAVLAGSVCGSACANFHFHQPRVPLWLGLTHLDSKPLQLLLGSALLLASGAFGVELFAATQANLARQQAVTVNSYKPLDTRAEQFDAVIDAGERALKFRPDDPELHRTIALQWITQYRVAAAEEIHQRSDTPKKLTGRHLWQATSLRVLSFRAFEFLKNGEFAPLERLRTLPLIRKHLVPARTQLIEAARHGPLTRDVSRLLAYLLFLERADREVQQQEMSQLLRQTMFVAPSSAEQLYTVGALADLTGLQELSDQAFRRSLTVSPDFLEPIWKELSRQGNYKERLDRILPDRVDLLVTLAEQIEDELSKSSLADRAARLLNEETWEDAVEPNVFLRARLAQVQGRTDDAIRYLRDAVQDDPMNVDTRWQLADMLERAGRLSEAQTEFSVVQGLVPGRHDVETRLQNLKKRQFTRESMEKR